MPDQQPTNHTEFREFDDRELAILRRVDATPPTRDGVYLNDTPITPAGPILTVEELVPWPDAETATAADWSTYFLATAAAHSKSSMHHLPLPARSARTGSRPQAARPATGDMATYLEHLGRYTDAYLLGHLLRHVPDDVARAAFACALDGEAADENVWGWLEDAGVNPGRIRSAPSNAEDRATIAVRELATS